MYFDAGYLSFYATISNNVRSEMIENDIRNKEESFNGKHHYVIQMR